MGTPPREGGLVPRSRLAPQCTAAAPAGTLNQNPIRPFPGVGFNLTSSAITCLRPAATA
jgi:hypothetical protein